MALKLTALFLLIAAFEIVLIHAFRSDYTYIDSTRGYYKLYRNTANWSNAKSTCQAEGASLFYPNSESELTKVLHDLDVGENNGNNFWIGMSDLDEHGTFKTLDGRHISQVYNKWGTGLPSSTPKQNCVSFYIKNNNIYVDECHKVGSYICKHQAAVIEDVIIANASNKIALETSEKEAETIKVQAANQVAALKWQLGNQTAAFETSQKEAETIKVQAANQVAALKWQLGNQTAALEASEKEAETIKEQVANQVTALKWQLGNKTAALEVLERQAAVMQQPAANQSPVSEQMVESIVNQTIALNRLTWAMQRQVLRLPVLEKIPDAIAHQAAVLERFVEADTNQTKAMERQALALETLASVQDNSNQLDPRSNHE